MNNRHLEHLARGMVERQYAPGQPIVTQGHGGEGFFVIVSGKAEAFRQRADGEKVTVNTFGPTDFLASSLSWMMGCARHLSLLRSTPNALLSRAVISWQRCAKMLKCL